MEFDFKINEQFCIKNLEADLNIQQMIIQSHLLMVDDFSSAHLASCLLFKSRKMEKYLNELKNEANKPLSDAIKNINLIVKDINEKIHLLKTNLEEKILNWMKSENELPFGQIEKISVEEGTLHLKDTYEFEIEDENLLPREYLSVNPREICNAINSGVRNIPGIKIFREKSLQTRLKNNN